MKHFKVSQKAQNDLIDIGLYTQNNYGIHQRDQYLNTLQNLFQRIADNPELGLNRDEIKSGYHSALCGKHIIFFLKKPYGVRIIRVLHQNMDVPNNLEQS